MNNWRVKAVGREVLFRRFARQSGEVLCTEPTSLPVERETQPHGELSMFDGAPCEKCGACV